MTLLLLNISNEWNYMETTKHQQQKEAYDRAKKKSWVLYSISFVLQEDRHQL